MKTNDKGCVMQKMFLGVAMVAVVLSSACVRAESDTETKPEQAGEKLWLTDYDQALKVAAAQKRPVLVDFTGSDWCGWCVKLKKEVFNTYEFKRFARENLVCVELDFPRRKRLPRNIQEQNEELKNQYGIRGFPTIIILSPQGRVVARTGYREGGATKYVEYLQGLIGD